MLQTKILPYLSDVYSSKRYAVFSVSLILGFAYWMGLLLSEAGTVFFVTVHRISYAQILNEQALGGNNLVYYVVATAAFMVALCCPVLPFRKAVLGALSLSSIVLAAIFNSNLALANPFLILVFPASVLLAAYFAFVNKTEGRKLGRAVLVSLAIGAIAVSIGSIARWLAYMMVRTDVLSDVSWFFARIETYSWSILALITPIILLAICASFLIQRILRDIPFLRSHVGLAVLEPGPQLANRRKVVLILVGIMILSSLLVLIPHLPTVNPEEKQVGVDTPAYLSWINTLESQPENFAPLLFSELSNGDRPLTMVILLAYKNIFSFDAGLKYVGAIISPLFVYCSYVFTNALAKNNKAALVAALLAALSATVVVGIYASFYANWLALSVLLLGFTVVLKMMPKVTYLHLLVLTALIIAVQLLHGFTWMFSIGALLVFVTLYSAFNLKQYRSNLKLALPVAFVLVAIAVSVSFDLIKGSYFAAPSNVQQNVSYSGNLFSVEEFAQRWGNLRYALTVHVGGFLANIAMSVLALVWAIRSKYRDTKNLLVLSMFYVSLVPIVFGDFNADARIYYNLPFAIVSALLIYQASARMARNTMILFVITIVLLNLTYVLRAFSNLDLIQPAG